MKKTYLYKFLISSVCLILACSAVFAKSEKKIISFAPSITEIVYFLNLENNLLAITRNCNYPAETKNKEIIGNTFSINREKIVELYLKNNKNIGIFALISSKPFLLDFAAIQGIEFEYFEFKNIDSIFSAISRIAKLYGVEHDADLKIAKMKSDIAKHKTKNGKNILYLIQCEPMITIGKDSYIADVIKHSGNFSVTSNLNGEYPSISKEYTTSLPVDIVVIDNFQNKASLNEFKLFFPDAKFVKLTQAQKDVINRPGPRVVEAVKIFSEISKISQGH